MVPRKPVLVTFVILQLSLLLFIAVIFFFAFNRNALITIRWVTRKCATNIHFFPQVKLEKSLRSIDKVKNKVLGHKKCPQSKTWHILVVYSNVFAVLPVGYLVLLVFETKLTVGVSKFYFQIKPTKNKPR